MFVGLEGVWGLEGFRALGLSRDLGFRVEVLGLAAWGFKGLAVWVGK